MGGSDGDARAHSPPSHRVGRVGNRLSIASSRLDDDRNADTTCWYLTGDAAPNHHTYTQDVASPSKVKTPKKEKGKDKKEKKDKKKSKRSGEEEGAAGGEEQPKVRFWGWSWFCLLGFVS